MAEHGAGRRLRRGLHYLKAVADMGPAAAKADGRAVVARMKAMPTDDDCFGQGQYPRGRAQAASELSVRGEEALGEHSNPWDGLKLIATTPADQAFRPIGEGGCPLVRT